MNQLEQEVRIRELERQLAEIGAKFDKLLNGHDNKMGLLDMMDSYYGGCCDNEIAELEKLIGQRE